MLDSLKETVFSMHSKANKCTHELQRPGQYAQDLNRFKPEISHEGGEVSTKSHPFATGSAGRERPRSHQWSGIGCIRHTPEQVPCSVVGQHKLSSMIFSGTFLLLVVVMVGFFRKKKK